MELVCIWPLYEWCTSKKCFLCLRHGIGVGLFVLCGFVVAGISKLIWNILTFQILGHIVSKCSVLKWIHGWWNKLISEKFKWWLVCSTDKCMQWIIFWNTLKVSCWRLYTFLVLNELKQGKTFCQWVMFIFEHKGIWARAFWNLFHW